MRGQLRQIELTGLLVLLVTVSVARGQNRDHVARDREEAQPAPSRDGGIPRAEVLPGDETHEGTEEGLPRTRSSPTERGISPFLLPPERHRWKLGIYARNTDTGVVATRVARGSAASRSGLERGDRIVAVDGFQVGWVQDNLYPLGHELQRQGGRRGVVTLLIQNVRTNRLLNREIQLDHARRGR